MNWLRGLFTVQLWGLVMGFYTANIGLVYLLDAHRAARRTYLWSGARSLGEEFATALAVAFLLIGWWMILGSALSRRAMQIPALVMVFLWGYTFFLYMIAWPESGYTMLTVPVPALISSIIIRIRTVFDHTSD